MSATVYHANFRATRLRDSGFADSVIIGAGSDANAQAVAAAIQVVCAAQMVSLRKRIYSSNLNANHPVGSRLTLNALTLSATNQIYRVRLRNLKSSVTIDDIITLLTGVAPLGYAGPVIPGVNVFQPNSGSQIAVANVAIIDKP